MNPTYSDCQFHLLHTKPFVGVITVEFCCTIDSVNQRFQSLLHHLDRPQESTIPFGKTWQLKRSQL